MSSAAAQNWSKSLCIIRRARASPLMGAICYQWFSRSITGSEVRHGWPLNPWCAMGCGSALWINNVRSIRIHTFLQGRGSNNPDLLPSLLSTLISFFFLIILDCCIGVYLGSRRGQACSVSNPSGSETDEQNNRKSDYFAVPCALCTTSSDQLFLFHRSAAILRRFPSSESDSALVFKRREALC